MNAQYVDGFLIPVPQDKIEQYREMSAFAGKLWKEYGALDYRECVGDDLENEGMTSFRQSAGARENEVVVFSWILYASKEERNRINERVMNDPRLKQACVEGVFDFNRMAWGGFKTLVLV
ncbi:DUF1428 domain-containing protein [Orrella sp. JC864]|uniref:DUF1428 domain-containing protein n=1 Tax=Orrella sp. JC864 TaxID=3120298 RepID=UPI0012BB92AB